MSTDERLDDDQLEEKKKILMLGDKAAFDQQAAVTIDKNKDLIEHLKQQNTDLRKRVIQLQRENLSVHSNDSVGKKRQLQDDLIRLRKEVDAQVNLRQERMKQKKKLEEQLNELTSLTPVGGETASKKRIRSLENQLDKTIIKYNEAQSIKKTYEQIVKRLNEEQSNFNAQLEEMEEQMRQKNEDYEELLLMQKAARSAREMANQEVRRLRDEMRREQDEYNRILEEKRATLDMKMEARERKEQEEKARRAAAAGDASISDEEGDTGSMAGDYSRKKYAMGTTTPTDNQIAQIQERLAQDEEAFRKIKEATGDDDVNKVIQKFLVQAEYLKECDERRTATESRLERAKAARAEAKELLEQAKEANTEKISAKVAMDDTRTRLSRLKSSEDEGKKRYIEAKQLQMEVKEGLRILCQNLSIVCFDAQAAGVDDSQIQHLSAADTPNADMIETDPKQVFDKLTACMEFLHQQQQQKEESDRAEQEAKEEQRRKLLEEGVTLEELEEQEKEEAALKEEEAEVEEEAEEAQVVPEGNTRIVFDDDLNDDDDNDMDDDDDYGTSQGHALDERVLDRDAIKRAAQEAVELAAQRAKKAKKEDEY